MNCERITETPEGERVECANRPKGYELFDYCALCLKNLCPEHFAEGCCGHKPARSGQGVDAEAEDLDDDLELVDEESDGA